jgi:hypothetical protein
LFVMVRIFREGEVNSFFFLPLPSGRRSPLRKRGGRMGLGNVAQKNISFQSSLLLLHYSCVCSGLNLHSISSTSKGVIVYVLLSGLLPYNDKDDKEV